MIALSRQSVLRRKMDIIANNLANMNTGGFKAGKMVFIEQLQKNPNADGMVGNKLAFVRDIASVRDTTAGPLERTGNPLDIAIEGEGYFAVQTPEGERYTRNGRFQLDSQGQLVTLRGAPVLSDAGAPFFFAPEEKDITVAGDGTVSTENGAIGRLRVVRFENEQEMKATRGGLYQSDAAPIDLERPAVAQGMVEKSNVESVIEITKMISVSRSYSSVSKFIEKEDERIKRMVRELGSPLGA